MMVNIRPHKINIPSKVIEKCWRVYSQKYKEIESRLSNSPTFPIKSLQKNLHYTGAFQLQVSQLSKLPQDSLTDCFVSDHTTRLTIRLRTKIILRGIDYFVGIQNNSNAEKLEIIFSRLIEFIGILDQVQLSPDKVLYLSLLDYIRNYLMIVLYAIHQSARELGVPKNFYRHYEVFLELVKHIEEGYISTLLTNEITPQKVYLTFIPHLFLFREYFRRTIPALNSNNKLSLDLSRRIRECDNPIKILNFAKSVGNEYFPRKTLLIGLEYGGIELPFAVNAYRKAIGKSNLGIVTVNLSSYSVGSNRYIDSIEDALSPFFLPNNLEECDTAVILDDSITTGRTLEYLSRLLPQKIENIYFRCVSFTNTNRYHHLTRFEHGGVNPVILDTASVLYKSNFAQTYTRRSYTNRQGVFDKKKNRIIKMLKDYYPKFVN